MWKSVEDTLADKRSVSSDEVYIYLDSFHRHQKIKN